MNNFWSTLGISVTGSVLLSGLLVWLCREWISARLRKSIQHEYDVKLEGFKAGYQKFLAENEIRFSWWHEEKAKAIKEIYNELAELSFCLQYMQTLETDPRWQILGKEQVRANLITRFTLNIQHNAEKWLKLRLFLEDMEDQQISAFCIKTDQLFTLYAHAIMNNTSGVLETDGEKILKNINDIMETLRHRFQDILQGKDAEK